MAVEPRIVRGDDENRLAGYAALPLDLNPYRSALGDVRQIAGVVLPAAGTYEVVQTVYNPGGQVMAQIHDTIILA